MYQFRKITDWLVVHCTATPPQMDIGVAEVRSWHRKAGWIDIGYHFVIRRDGTVETGRPVNTVGAGVSGYNLTSIHISLVGGTDKNNEKAENNFTAAQFIALEAKLKELHKSYPNAKVQGHRDFPKVAKDCPSFDAIKWWKSVENKAPEAAPVICPDPSLHVHTYTVQKGDTLYRIALKSKCTVAAIQKLNPDLVAKALEVGTVIKLPIV